MTLARSTTMYYETVRYEILPLLPPQADRVLEVGCAEGNTLAWIKSIRGCSWIGGVELINEVAERARTRVDEVYLGNIETMDLPLEKSSLDMVLCLDVLEHLIDPWGQIGRLHRLLKPGGVLIASIPNIRHYSIIYQLLFNGSWNYRQDGLLDKTHLRFFTRSTAIQLVECSGLRVDMVIDTRIKRRRDMYADKITFSIFKAFFEYQYLIRAHRID